MTMSPSGWHLGIYKALRKHVKKKEKKNTDTLPETTTDPPTELTITQGHDILYAIFDIMLLAICHEYPFQQWKTVWMLFTKKELGNLHLNQLRCIMIFEADWQLLLKWHLSYRFLPKTKTAGTLVYAQGGGHKGHSAIDQAAQQIIKTEVIHLHQNTTINLYLDLRQCFDMMVKACHNLACHRHGAEDAYLKLHEKMHKAMKYYVCHKFAVSKDCNTSKSHPWHGAGQGTADAALWYIALSDTLIDAYHTKVVPQMMSNPLNSLTILQSLNTFIDNVVIHATANTQTPYPSYTATTSTIPTPMVESNCLSHQWGPESQKMLCNCLLLDTWPTQHPNPVPTWWWHLDHPWRHPQSPTNNHHSFTSRHKILGAVYHWRPKKTNSA